MPLHAKTMRGVAEYVFRGPSVTAWCAALTEFAFRDGEYRVLTCDGTVKVALVQKGYKGNIFRTSAAKAHMAWEMLSRVFTVRGTTGFIIGAVPIKDEASSIVATTLAGLVLQERRHCVEYVVVDSASKELWKSLRVVFPCLRGDL